MNKKIERQLKIKVIFGYALYNLVGKKLLKSHSFFDPLRISKKIRYFEAKLIVKKIGKNVNIERNATFGRRLEIGDNSGIGVNASIAGKVIIKNNVLMGPDCKIYSRNHKFSTKKKPIIKQGYSKEKVVIIGEDVWIGGRVSILPGVTISKGSIIGACSVVREDVPEYAIVFRNPARVICFRKEKDVAE